MDEARQYFNASLLRLLHEVKEEGKQEEAERWKKILDNQNQTINGDEWVNQSEAKKILQRTSDNTLTDWVKKGTIQRRKIGAFWYYKKSELLKLYK